ncbi:MAG: DUF4350 domain-containing protein [Clostridiales bacterium]|jgi:hypothetical protein|nr:DUF4350 domain-containing protein [Clostridiales bacterium]
MLKRQSKGIVIILIMFLLFFVVNFFVVGMYESTAPNFSTYDTEGKGTALLYDTLSKMGYSVDRGFEFVTLDADTRQTQLLIQPAMWFSPDEQDEIMEWVASGGRLIVLESGGYTQFDYYFEDFYFADVANDYYYGYYYGLGMIVTGDSGPITNAALMENSRPGAALAEILGQTSHGRIVFNEAIHGYVDERSTWQKVPDQLKVIVFHIAILAFYLVWHYGKRFGEPIMYYEEVEREENEHAKALANLYNASLSYEVAAGEGLDQFIRCVAHAFHVSEKYASDNISRLWRNAGLQHQDWVDNLFANGGKMTRGKMRRNLCKLKSLTKILYQKGESDAVHAVYHSEN